MTQEINVSKSKLFFNQCFYISQGLILNRSSCPPSNLMLKDSVESLAGMHVDSLGDISMCSKSWYVMAFISHRANLDPVIIFHTESNNMQYGF